LSSFSQHLAIGFEINHTGETFTIFHLYRASILIVLAYVLLWNPFMLPPDRKLGLNYTSVMPTGLRRHHGHLSNQQLSFNITATIRLRHQTSSPTSHTVDILHNRTPTTHALDNCRNTLRMRPLPSSSPPPSCRPSRGDRCPPPPLT
jgi:hypothetical protein